MIELLFLAKDKGEDWREEEEGREGGKGDEGRERDMERNREMEGEKNMCRFQLKLVGRVVSTVWRHLVFSNTVRIR